jgi:GAF domain-containing protein
VRDPIPKADIGDGRNLDRETARRLIAGTVSVNPAVRELMSHVTRDYGGVARLLKIVLTDADRLTALHNTGLLDGAPRLALDQFAELTAEALGVPYAAVWIVADDRQICLGSNHPGATARSYPLDTSIGKYAVASDRPLIIDDITKHPVLADHRYALTGEIRAYAAFPLHDVGGNAVGTLSAWDVRPRPWTSGQIQILEDLSAAAHAKILGA